MICLQYIEEKLKVIIFIIKLIIRWLFFSHCHTPGLKIVIKILHLVNRNVLKHEKLLHVYMYEIIIYVHLATQFCAGKQLTPLIKSIKLFLLYF